MTKKIKIKKNIEILIFDNKEKYLKNLVINFRKDLKKNKLNKLIFPGGNTPISFFKKLSKEKINWKNIRISLTDERLIINKKIMSYESNFTSLQKNLFYNLSYNNFPEYIPLPNKNMSYSDKIYGNFIEKSAVYLGVGEDGHIASIFNNDFDISEKRNIFFTSKKHSKHKRVSWTFNSLLKSNKIIFLLSGRKKKNLISNIVNGTKRNNLPYLKLIQEYKNQIKVMYCSRST